MPFRQHMGQMAARTLAEFPEELISDIYAVTFRIDSVDQDPRFPYLAIGYNTEAEAARANAETADTEPWESRWNYAYFPPSGLEGVRVIGHDPAHDPVGSDLHRQEAVTQGLWYEEEDEDCLSEQEQDERGEALAEQFRELCVDLARRLHEDGTLVGVLGRPLPVILYDMFDPDEMFAMTRAANPPDLVTEFLSEDPQAQSQV
ncbi:hypothetical protein OG302_03540 [Streptomyces sp. NBC_01283]|uniref:hypothetical protein n=1 Tax=Streptomyces sp. NBC_01283 TaxID=2903812 RepID=UPI00352D7EB7|nr:hypothetical protein OG302_03540 [Streptomyces sp. NBC_01283]